MSAVTRAQVIASVEANVWRTLGQVLDPEIPVISVVDLGIVRHVRVHRAHMNDNAGDGGIEVGITPTYSGCPATEVIRSSVQSALHQAGYTDARVIDVLSPPWTSDWITDRGREQLKRYGIAPPATAVSSPRALFARPAIACPRCNSTETQRISEFGSTPCKAHYRCKSCAEPFDYFKCI